MRKRTTWRNSPSTSSVASTNRRADVYTMNQDHKQPAMETAYANGDADSWAESPAKPGEEQDNERNELGLAEFHPSTWKHKDSEKWNDGKKYDNARAAADRKAMAATKIASILLPKTASPEAVSDQAVDLMGLSDRATIATLRRLEAASKTAAPVLSEEGRRKRAYACAKLAYRMISASKSEVAVESLGRTFMAMDDSILKSMIRQVAAADEETKKDEPETEVAAGEAPEAPKAPEAETAGGSAPEGAPWADETETAGSEADDDSGLTAEEMVMLDSMLPGGEAPAAPGLEGLLAPAAPLEPVHMNLELAPAAPSGESFEIAFDEEEGTPAELAAFQAGASSLDQLFATDVEVAAQREIQAASDASFKQELGFAPVRQASTGAKKLGNVKVASAPVAEVASLKNLWD